MRHEPVSRSSSRTSSICRSRPAKLVIGSGRLPGIASSERIGGEVGRQPADHQLEDMLGAVEVLEMMLAEIVELADGGREHAIRKYLRLF